MQSKWLCNQNNTLHLYGDSAPGNAALTENRTQSPGRKNETEKNPRDTRIVRASRGSLIDRKEPPTLFTYGCHIQAEAALECREPLPACSVMGGNNVRDISAKKGISLYHHNISPASHAECRARRDLTSKPPPRRSRASPSRRSRSFGKERSGASGGAVLPDS